MLQYSLLITLMIQLTVAIVGRNDVQANEEQTTIPTAMYKPMEPVTEHSSSKIVLSAPQENNNFENMSPFPNLGGLGNFRKQTVVTTYSSDDNINKPNHMQHLRPVFTRTRFEGLNNPNPMITHSWSNNPLDETNPGSGFYRMSSSSSYFNSDTMNEPVTRHFEYDSRNGDAFPNNGFPNDGFSNDGFPNNGFSSIGFFPN